MTVTNTAVPTVSGTAQVGQTLTTSNGQWTFDLDYLGYTYQWLRCDAAGANCVDIGGATSAAYVVAVADVGHRLRSEVTATEYDYPPGDVLSWAPPTAGEGGVAVVNWTMTNANRQSSSLLSGGGRDLVITSGEALTGPVAQLNNWRHVIWIGGAITITATGQNNYALPIAATGTVHLEGLDIECYGDVTMSRGGSSSCIWQVQNCRLESHFLGEPYEHADCFQTQGSGSTKINQFRMDRVTLTTDYQGMFVRPEGASAYVNSGDLRKVNYRRRTASDPAQAWLFLADEDPSAGHTTGAVGPFAMSDVWMDQASSTSTQVIYPDQVFSDFKVGGNYTNRQGVFRLTDGTSDYWRASTTADTVPAGGPASGQQCLFGGFTGIVRIGVPPGGDWCPDGTPGMSYISPGYA